MKTTKTSPNKIDIICPCIKEHITRLKVCKQSWEKHIGHRIGDIFIVGPSNIKQDIDDIGWNYVNENDFIGLCDDDFKKIRKDRRGWLKQQIIKLNGNIGKCDNYLVIDSDVFLIRPTTFINEEGNPIFYMNNAYWNLAIKTAEKLLDKQHTENLSYVTDKMIFNNNVIKQLQKCIEETNKQEWKRCSFCQGCCWYAWRVF